MTMSALLDVHNPTINVLRDITDGHAPSCHILIVTNADGDSIKMHFDNREDYNAFVGILQMIDVNKRTK